MKYYDKKYRRKYDIPISERLVVVLYRIGILKKRLIA